MINQMEIMIQEMKLSLIHKFNIQFCDYSDACILVRSDNTATGARATQVPFKSCAPFTKCITKSDGATIDDALDLDLVMPIYNLIEQNSNYSETTGSLWFYSKDEASNFNPDIASDDNFKLFKCKAILLGNTTAQPDQNQANEILENVTIIGSLRYLSNFWRLLEMIN